MSTPRDRRKRHGVHYTPPPLAAFLAERAAAALAGWPGAAPAFVPPGVSGATPAFVPPVPVGWVAGRCRGPRPLRVLDPACGDGELLLAAGAALGPGAELVGYDRDAAAAAAAASRLAALPATVHAADFLTADLPPGGFDLIITNPPYVRTQVLGAERSAALSARLGLRGRVDLTHAFVAVSRRLLADGGVLALLCANRFLFTRAGANVRRALLADYRLHELYDLGDTRLFGAAVLPAIVVASATPAPPEPLPRATARYVRAYQTGGPPGGDLYEALRAHGSARAGVGGRAVAVTVGGLETGADPAEPWRQRTAGSDAWRARVEARTWRRFGDLARIRVGIKSTADAVFVRDDWESLPEHARPERELLLPLLTHRNVTAWAPPTDPATRVLYPYDLSQERRRVLDLGAYPRARSYLDVHAPRLRGRRYVAAAGREWYELWVPQRPALWRTPKIVFPDISVGGRFAIDRSGAVVNGDCYWFTVDELPGEDVALLMIGVANSTFGARFYDRTCGNQLYAGRRRWITQYVERFPVPEPSGAAARRVVEVARKLCEPGAGGQQDLRTLLDQAVDAAFGGPDPSP